MTDPQIRFGTDGWRGVIARDFTFRNVERVAQATADYFRTVPHGHEALLVGFDVRFLSPRFARATAEVLSANGFRVELLKGVCPTPYVSWAVRKMGFRGGVVITASHNPSEFNGFKVKAHYGGSATPDITAGIEACLDRNEIRSGGPLEEVALSPDYFDHLRSMVDWNRIAESRLRIAVDSMHGSGGTLLEDLLRNTRCAVRTIRGRGDPLFGGVSPEPIMPALAPLSRAVIETGAAIGLATDGDADRLGVVDEDGRFVSTLEVLPLLLLHAYRNRGWRGAVAYTVSQSQIVPRIGASLGLDLHETPIGCSNGKSSSEGRKAAGSACRVICPRGTASFCICSCSICWPPPVSP
jgi:phosphomannomutase